MAVQVARAWYELLHLHHARHPDVAAAILDTVKLYVNWIDISLGACRLLHASAAAGMLGWGGRGCR